MFTKITFTSILLIVSFCVQAQTPSDALAYMEKIGSQYQTFSASTWAYISAASHGKSARKVESRRKELINTALAAQKSIAAMPPFDGDKAYRDSAANYFRLCGIVFSQDYGQIVNLEEVAEQSYDAMEAYMTAKALANEKLNEAGERMEVFEKIFASEHNITLHENEDKLSQNLEKAGEVYDHYNPLYLIFFKCYKQEVYLLDAIGKGDVNGMSQNQNALTECATASLETLKGYSCYKNNCSLVRAANALMLFYQREAKESIPVMTAYFLQRESFEKIQKAFNAIPQNKRTQEDANRFNAGVEASNKATEAYNKTNAAFNQERATLIAAWNKAVDTFLDTNVPH